MNRRIVGIAMGLLAVLAFIMVGYPLAGWIGSSIPQNSDWTEPAEGIDIMVETNGTHTGIVVPVANDIQDWREIFPSAVHTTAHGYPTHLAIGYGEREVFLNVPTWSDLSAVTALRIVTVGGEPIMRVGHYVRPTPSENHRPVRITREQYARLVAVIERALPEVPPGADREILRGTYGPDAYYDAFGSYTMVNNCNSWVGATLAEAGVPMGLWTPMAGGVMKWIPTPEET